MSARPCRGARVWHECINDLFDEIQRNLMLHTCQPIYTPRKNFIKIRPLGVEPKRLRKYHWVVVRCRENERYACTLCDCVLRSSEFDGLGRRQPRNSRSYIRINSRLFQ